MMLKLIGALLLVLGIAALLGALIDSNSENLTVPDIAGEQNTLVYGIVGGAMFITGIVLFLIRPATRTKKPKAAVSPQQVEIKRTKMEFAPKSLASDLQNSRLESIDQRIAQLKVSFGMEQISRETYRREIQLLDQERAQAEAELRKGP